MHMYFMKPQILSPNMSRSMSSFKVKGQIKVNVIGGHLSLTVTALVVSYLILSDQGFPQEFLKACCFEIEGVGAGGVTPPS